MIPFAAAADAGGKLGVALALCTLLALLTGCARLVKPPQDDLQARALVEFMVGANKDLAQFKGLGNLRMESRGEVLSGRMAWAAVSPDKLRVEWLNMLGQPMTSLAGDGRHITIVTLNDGKLHRTKQKRKALAGAIHVPVGIEDLVALLAGRLPLPDFTAAWMAATGQAGCRYIELKGRRANTLALIQVDETARRPQIMTVFGAEGEMQYRIEWVSWQELNGRRLPRFIQVEADSGEKLTFSLERYWLNAALPSDAFVLTAPKR